MLSAMRKLSRNGFLELSMRFWTYGPRSGNSRQVLLFTACSFEFCTASQVFEGKWLATWERRSLRLVYSRDVLHPIGLPCLALVWRVSLFPVTRCRSNLGP